MTIISSRVPQPGVSLGRGLPPPLESGGLVEGDHLGQFLLQEFVGGGGMGIVFRALDTTLNREVAVKVLSRDQSADDETLRRFRNEAQSTARLDHDNIARVHYVGEDRGVHYIVFEFIEGVNIRDLVEQQGPLALDQAISYTYQIAEALEHASQRNVIHRDIKPSNVLITPDGKAKLVDMGLARLHQLAASDDLTASGVTLGTFDYISPEQARDPRSADVRSDMYSLGCSLFYMLTGRPPFPEGTVLQKLLQHQGDDPPDPRVLRPELPSEVARIMAKLLAKNPAQRYQQPAELINELVAFGDKLGMNLRGPRRGWVRPQSTNPVARWQHHVPWALPLAALFAIVMVLDVYWSGGVSKVAGPLAAPAAKVRSPEPQPPRGTPIEGPVRTAPADPREISQPPIVTPNVESPAAKAPDADPSPPAPESFVEPVEPAAKAKPVTPPPWIQQMAKSLGVDLNFQRWAARASATANRLQSPPGAKAAQEAETAEGDSTGGAVSNTPATTLRGNVLAVGDDAGPHNFASLHAACSSAKSGDTIELRFNGRCVEKPITIANTKLTIRAGAGYQPVVVFKPALIDSVKFLPSMLSVAGSQLSVSGVHWELDLPRNVPAEWSLFETRRAELLEFERCTFTIRNASLGQTAYHAGVAFFDIKAPPGTGTIAMDPTVMEEQIVTISLRHCLARGEAALLRDNELQAVRLNWDNGLLATSEPLLVAAGGPSQPRQLGHIQLNLRHLTAMIRGGLALLTNREDAPYQLLTEIGADDSIFVSTARPALVEQRGSDRVDEYTARLQWSGDHDFFDGFDVFWRINNTAAGTNPRQHRFDDWQDLWRKQSRWQLAGKDSVRWLGLPAAERAYHTHTPSDYALAAESGDNPALAGASDGLDAGCLAKQLPTLPPEESVEPRAAPRAPAPPRNLDGSVPPIGAP
jgi:serine/threonine-protein kinase